MAPVMALSTSTTWVRRPSMLVSELRAWEAVRTPSRSMVPVMRVARRRAGGSWSVGCRLVSGCLQGRVGPVEVVDLGGGAPGVVFVAGLGEEGVAGVFHAVGEVERGGAFQDQGAVPGALAGGGFALGGVVGA